MNLEFCLRVTQKPSLYRLFKKGSKKNENSPLNIDTESKFVKVPKLHKYLKNKRFKKRQFPPKINPTFTK